MKKLLVVVLLLGSAFAQTFAGRAGSDIFITPPFRFCLGQDDAAGNCALQTGSQLIRWTGAMDFQLASKTVATLPPAALNTGRVYRVTDGLTASDCTVGGGTSSNVCTSDGSLWKVLGGGGAGAPQAALPAAPLINQGASTTPVYAAGTTYYTTAQNWSESQTSSLTAGVASSLTLAAGHAGVDVTSGFGYQVYLNDGANSEAVSVTGGTYTFAGGGTILFTPFFNHGPGAYTVGSASSGIQETLNSACGTDPTYYKNRNCNVTLPGNGPGNPSYLNYSYDVYGSIFVHTQVSEITGFGATLACRGRAPCLVIGNMTGALNSGDFARVTVKGLHFRAPVARATADYNGCTITNMSKTAQVVTVTTSASCPMRPGDMITIMFTDNSRYWGDKIVSSIISGTQFTYADQGADIASAATPGVVALAFDAVLDTQTSTTFDGLGWAQSVGDGGIFNNFFDFWDDEDALITRFLGISSVNNSATWSGSYIFSGGNPFVTGTQWAPVITIRDSSITANGGNCATIYNNNGFYMDNVVCQASGLWQVYSSNITGNYQGASLRNIYSESGVGLNPSSPAHSPFPGTGIAGLIAVNRSSSTIDSVTGTGPVFGAFPVLGAGVANHFQYFIVAKDVTAGTQTSPMRVEQWNSSGVDSPIVTWPRVANGADTITYDIVRADMGASITQGSIFPYNGGCTGGSVAACGSVTTGLTQAAACGNTLVCTFTDNPAAATTSYAVGVGNYQGSLSFWPGSIVASVTVHTDTDMSPTVAVALSGNTLSTPVLQAAKRCSTGEATAGGFTVCSSAQGSNNTQNPAALLLNDIAGGGGGALSSQGKLTFLSPISFPHEIITLLPGSQAKTQATNGFRPAWDANDTWIGSDNKAGGDVVSANRLAFGSPAGIASYVGALPNSGVSAGTNWLELLTATKKTFQVPLALVEQAAPTGTAGQSLLWGDSTSHRLSFNPNNTGALSAVGIGAAATSGHLAAFAPNGIDLVDGGGAGAGTVTSSGPPTANEVPYFTTATNLAGVSDFLLTPGSPNKVTIPALNNTSASTLNFNGDSGMGFGASNSTSVGLFANSGSVNPATLNFLYYNAGYVNSGQIVAGISTYSMNSLATNNSIVLTGNVTTSTNSTGYNVKAAGSAMTATGNNQAHLWVSGNFAPTSGTAKFHDGFFNPTINQTGGANGTVRIVAAYPLNTALVGTEYLFAGGTASTADPSAVLTDKFTVDSSGNVVAQGTVSGTQLISTIATGTAPFTVASTTQVTNLNASQLIGGTWAIPGTIGSTTPNTGAFTTLTGTTYNTTTNCSANGTAVNPSVVSCSSAAAGAFSCDVAASAATCTINTTAVTANSEIFVTLVSDEGTRLGVTCNTAPTTVPAIYVATKTAATGFTINMPTITTNPACFDYHIVN